MFEIERCVGVLQSQEVEREATLVHLADENGALRARLRGVAHSPLSDSEKRQLLLAPAPRRMHSSAPASIALAHNVRTVSTRTWSARANTYTCTRELVLRANKLVYIF